MAEDEGREEKDNHAKIKRICRERVRLAGGAAEEVE